MWKRIHSNRDPRDTLYSELRKEFSGYFEFSSGFFKSVINKKPWWSWSLMLFLMAISVLLSFTVFRYKDVPKAATPHKGAQVSAGFSQILTTTYQLRKVIGLKQAIDSLTARKELSKADSVKLNVALDSLAAIQQSLNLQHHEH
jgi:hypothetical protein